MRIKTESKAKTNSSGKASQLKKHESIVAFAQVENTSN